MSHQVLAPQSGSVFGVKKGLGDMSLKLSDKFVSLRKVIGPNFRDFHLSAITRNATYPHKTLTNIDFVKKI
jgi:hypothetical protein